MDEEVQKAVAEAQEEAEERLRETEDRHRKLIDRLEKHTRQALKVRCAEPSGS